MYLYSRHKIPVCLYISHTLSRSTAVGNRRWRNCRRKGTMSSSQNVTTCNRVVDSFLGKGGRTGFFSPRWIEELFYADSDILWGRHFLFFFFNLWIIIVLYKKTWPTQLVFSSVLYCNSKTDIHQNIWLSACHILELRHLEALYDKIHVSKSFRISISDTE
jgi:hypothetical protein